MEALEELTTWSSGPEVAGLCTCACVALMLVEHDIVPYQRRACCRWSTAGWPLSIALIAGAEELLS